MITTTKPITQALHSAALTGFFSLALLSPVTAADFSGSLKGVTITDAQATNKPPVAAFNYAVSGNTVSFDASSSSDPDGTIKDYRWDFGDGTKAIGPKAEHQFDVGSYNIMLSIVDNDSSVSIFNQKIDFQAPSLFSWEASSDVAEVPSSKYLVRTGSGTYTSGATCYSGECYDNVNTSNNIKLPVVNGDVINKDEFKITIFFKPKIISNYAYIFGAGYNANNVHLVHMYADGRLYCRTVLNGTKYYGYILDTGSNLNTNSWYKLTYYYSKLNKSIVVSVNDEKKIQLSNVDDYQGDLAAVYLAADHQGEQRANVFLDKVSIK